MFKAPAPPSHESVHQHVPAQRCYWSLIHAPTGTVMPRGGVLPLALRLEFGEDVPVEPESEPLHAVGVRVNNDFVLACAIPIRELEIIEHETLSLCPEQIPQELFSSNNPKDAPTGIDVRQLNFLVGRYEPRPLRRARVRRHAALALMLVVSCALVAVGLERRARMATLRAEGAVIAYQTLLDRTGVRDDSELRTKVENAVRVESAVARTQPPRDATRPFVLLASSWPLQTSEQDGQPVAVPLSLRVSGERMVISARVTGDPARWLGEFPPIDGWALAPPTITSQRETSYLALDLKLTTPSQSATSAGGSR